MESDPTQKLIERYFDNDLNDEELSAFQQRLSEDEAFAAAFQLEKELVDGVEAYGNEQLRNQLEAMHEEETAGIAPTNGQEIEEPGYVSPFDPQPVDGKVVSMVGRKWWLAAAVLVVGLVARWAFFERQPTPQQLYAIYAVHDFDFTEMGANDELLPKAEGLLKAKKYNESIAVLDNYLSTHQDDQKVRMAKAIALLESGNYQEALDLFKAVGQGSPIFENEVNWYIALTYLKQNEIENCKKALSGIPPSSPFYKDANNLLGYLK